MPNTNNILKKLPYDKYSAASIYEYSKGLLGKSLREFAYKGYAPKKGKGGLHHYLLLFLSCLIKANCWLIILKDWWKVKLLSFCLLIQFTDGCLP